MLYLEGILKMLKKNWKALLISSIVFLDTTQRFGYCPEFVI